MNHSISQGAFGLEKLVVHAPRVSILVWLALATAPVPPAAAAEATTAAAASDTPVQSEAATAESWLPAQVGNRWSYVYTRERRRVTQDAEQTVESLRGTRIDEVVSAAREVAPDAVEIHSVVRGRAENAATETVEHRRVVLSSRGAAFRIHLREAPNPVTGESQVFRFDPPFEGMRPDARRAEPWKSGVEQSGGLRTEYETEILGMQDAQTPSGLYEKCLVLRTAGRMTGQVEVYGESVAVDDGRVVITEWFAPDVGRVLAKTEVEQKLRMADGAALELYEKSQYALSSVELASGAGPSRPVTEPASPAPSATPAAAPAPAPAETDAPEPPTSHDAEPPAALGGGSIAP
jgi:hypothetical protein